jgi:hypothetical protein
VPLRLHERAHVALLKQSRGDAERRPFGERKLRDGTEAAQDGTDGEVVAETVREEADEVLDGEAQAALGRLNLSDPAACWVIHRRTFVGRHEVRHGAWRDERVLRLFNRTTAGFKAIAVHEEVQSQRSPRPLAGSILHYSFADCRDVLSRSLRYAPLKADILRATGEKTVAWMLPLRGLAAFVKSYVLRSGWRDGGIGFVIALGRVIDSTLPRALLLADDSHDAEHP